MTVKLLPEFLVVKAEKSQMNIKNPLRTETRTNPPFLVLAAAAYVFERVAESSKFVAEGTVLGNYFLSAFMKVAFGAMYTMINMF